MIHVTATLVGDGELRSVIVGDAGLTGGVVNFKKVLTHSHVVYIHTIPIVACLAPTR